MRKLLLVVCLLAVALPASADGAKRPICKPRHSKLLAKNSAVRVLYVSHPGQADEYGTPATVYGCFPGRRKRVKLFSLESTTDWKPTIMRLNTRFFAFAATTSDVVCEKYQQPDCTSYSVAAFKLSTGKARCLVSAQASALALTSNGWLASLSGTQLSTCDSRGVRERDTGAIDPASVRSSGKSVFWTRDGHAQSETLH